MRSLNPTHSMLLIQTACLLSFSVWGLVLLWCRPSAFWSKPITLFHWPNVQAQRESGKHQNQAQPHGFWHWLRASSTYNNIQPTGPWTHTLKHTHPHRHIYGMLVSQLDRAWGFLCTGRARSDKPYVQASGGQQSQKALGVATQWLRLSDCN